MLRATLSTTIRAVRTKSTGTEQRCIAIPLNCPDGDASLIRVVRAVLRARARRDRGDAILSDAERTHAHDWRRHVYGGRRIDDHGRRGISLDRHRLVGRRAFVCHRVRVVHHFNLGHHGRIGVDRLVVVIPSAAYVPPPAVTAFAPFLPPAPAFPAELSAIDVSGETALRKSEPAGVAGTARVTWTPRVARTDMARRTGSRTPGVTRPAGRAWAGWT